MKNKSKCGKDDKWCKIYHNTEWGTKGTSTAKKVAKQLDKIPHETYVEPFLGHGNVFKAMKTGGGSKSTILNDISCQQVRKAKKNICKKSDGERCKKLKTSKISCGKDFREVLKNHDSKGTLHYLDPPYTKTKKDRHKDFKHNKVTITEVIDASKGLQGKVAISYSGKPEFKKQLCKKPFKCKKIPKQLFNHKYYELLAIKK